jgi:hypothetical protein
MLTPLVSDVHSLVPEEERYLEALMYDDEDEDEDEEGGKREGVFYL